MADLKVLCYSLFSVLVLCLLEAEAGRFCHKRSSFYISTEYCTYGCCGSSYDQYCCGATVGLIVGCVFAGIVVVSVIVAVVCCCIKKQGQAGRVVHPSGPGNRNGTNVTVVYTGTSGHYPGPQPQYGMQPMGGTQPPQPPAYKQFDQPPPAYAYADPAYPPVAPVGPPVANPSAQPPAPGFNVSSTAPPATEFQRTYPPQ